MADKTIIIEREGVYRFEVTVGMGPSGLTRGGSITSDLHNDPEDTECDGSLQHFETALDAIESLVLAHACSGVNIETEAYQNGLDTAIEAIQNNLGE